jgi:precorrin-6x reductase
MDPNKMISLAEMGLELFLTVVKQLQTLGIIDASHPVAAAAKAAADAHPDVAAKVA